MMQSDFQKTSNAVLAITCIKSITRLVVAAEGSYREEEVEEEEALHPLVLVGEEERCQRQVRKHREEPQLRSRQRDLSDPGQSSNRRNRMALQCSSNGDWLRRHRNLHRDRNPTE